MSALFSIIGGISTTYTFTFSYVIFVTLASTDTKDSILAMSYS
jgi:hypothetical protein